MQESARLSGRLVGARAGKVGASALRAQVGMLELACGVARQSWHLDTAVAMESEMESGRVTVEAFDFFILYTAWLTRQDGDIFQERVA